VLWSGSILIEREERIVKTHSASFPQQPNFSMTEQSEQTLSRSPDVELALISINQDIEDAVVAKQLARLAIMYADDFIFTHGTGLVQTKSEWLDSLRDDKNCYVSRRPDHPSVELHSDTALLTGQLFIHRKSGDEHARYGVRYIRVFSKTTLGWKLVSHRTIAQWDL